MTSRSESIPHAGLEAIYHGAYPVVTCFGRAADDITDSGKLGKIVYTANPADLASTLENVMKSENLIEYCASVQARARKLFDYKTAVNLLSNRLTDIYAK